MVQVRFTKSIQRHVACPTETVEGATVRDVLESYFARHGGARGYVVDDRGSLRTHMVVFVNGRHVADRAALSDAVPDGATVDVMQALSGG